MHVFYINVASEVARRTALEDELARKLPADWPVTRVEAVTPATLDPAGTVPGLKPGENACFQSHRRALGLAAAAGGNALILEDDVRLARRSAAIIDRVVGDLGDAGWDLAFTDVAIPDPEPMLHLLLIRRQGRPEGRVNLLDLRQLPFCGSTAYVVNGASVARVAAEAAANRHGLPYDLMLRQAIYEERLQGRVIFPFPTTVSPAADASQIQPDGTRATDRVWNAFRRLMWIGRDVGEVSASLEALPPDLVDPETATFTRILAAALAPGLERK